MKKRKFMVKRFANDVQIEYQDFKIVKVRV